MKSGLLSRVSIGTFLAFAVFLTVVYGPSLLLVLLVACWSILATLEFVRLLRTADIELNPWFLGLLNLSVVAAAWRGWLPHFLLAPIAAVLIAAVALNETKPRIPVYGVFTIIYLGFLPAHLVMLKAACVRAAASNWLVFFPLLLTWMNDTAAWAVGSLLGRRKLAPLLSPNKTWEGFFAGLLVSAIVSGLFLSRFSEVFAGKHWTLLALYGIGLGTVAHTGDLFESIFKRAAGLKDTSSALGQHGGFLDRVDSLLFVIPAWHYLLQLYLA